MRRNHGVTVTTETITGRTAGGAPVKSVTTSTVYGVMQFNGGKLNYLLGGTDKQIDATFITTDSTALNGDKYTFNSVDYESVFENTIFDINGNARHYEITLRKKQ